MMVKVALARAAVKRNPFSAMTKPTDKQAARMLSSMKAWFCATPILQAPEKSTASGLP